MHLPPLSDPSFRGLIGVARREITPPVGINARCWGAAAHDVAEGIHKPLTLTVLTLQSNPADLPFALIAIDLPCWGSREAEWGVRGDVVAALATSEERVLLNLSHSHAAGPLYLRPDFAEAPGWELVKPFYEAIRAAAAAAARETLAAAQPALLAWRYGRCDLATQRDLHDTDNARIICGYNPLAPADDTLLVGRVTDAHGAVLATLVNYACHPTTLAWENRLISPDYIGALRETVEAATASPAHPAPPCLFLQGASGELAPAHQYVGDPAVADNHGRRLAHAALATLAGMQSPGTQLAFQGPRESGAPLAIWKPEPIESSTTLRAERIAVTIPLKPQEAVKAPGPTNSRVDEERERRRAVVRGWVGSGDSTELPVWLWQVGGAVLVAQQNEAYSDFQTALRAAFPALPLAVMNLTNGSIAYTPPAPLYDQNIYQVWQTPYAKGCAEHLREGTLTALQSFLQHG